MPSPSPLSILSILSLVFLLSGVYAAEDESASLAEIFGETESQTVQDFLSSESAPASAAQNYQRAWALSQLGGGQVQKLKSALCKAAGEDLSNAVKDKKKIDLAAAGEALKLSSLASCSAPNQEDLDAAVSSAKDSLTATSPSTLFAAISVLSSSHAKGKASDSDWSGAIQSLVDLQREDGTFGAEDDTEGTLDNAGIALNAIELIAGAYKLSSSDYDALSQIADKANHLVDKLMSSLDEANIAAVSQIFAGLHYLASTSAGQGKVSIDKENVALIADNLLSAKSAPGLGEAGHVIRAYHLLADNSFFVPPVVTVLTKTIKGSAKGQDGFVKVRVTDILGKSLGKPSVHLNSLSAGSDSVLSNIALEAEKGSETVFKFNALDKKVEHGSYTLDLRVSAQGKGRAEVDKILRTVRVTTSASISNFEINIADTKTNEGKTVSADYPKTISELSADYHQAIEFSFSVKSALTNKLINPHQAFVRFFDKKSDFEAVFVARVVDRKQKIKIVVQDAAADVFKNRQGVYDVEVIVGDVLLEDAIVWPVTKISLTFADDPIAEQPSVKPELHHTFRPAEKRPAAIISLVFTLLILAAGLIPFILIGTSIRLNFALPEGEKFLSSVIFLGSIGAILLLYAAYYFSLNMFQCLKYLAVLAVPAIFFGSKALA